MCVFIPLKGEENDPEQQSDSEEGGNKGEPQVTVDILFIFPCFLPWLLRQPGRTLACSVSLENFQKQAQMFAREVGISGVGAHS